MRGLSSIAPLLAAAALAAPLAAQQAGRPFTTEDALDVRSARIADVTRDGRRVALTVQTRRDRSGVDHFRFGDPTYVAPSLGELLVIDTDDGSSRSLFSEHEQLRGATWSPDGMRLAFFKLDDGHYRLYVHEVSSGRTRAVGLRTSRELSSGSPLAWSPDGASVLVGLRPERWAERARAAYLEMTEGPVVVQDGSDDFLDWDRVRNMGDEESPALVRLADGSVRELPGDLALRAARFSGDGAWLTYELARPKRTSYERAEGTDWVAVRLDLDGGVADTLLGPVERRIQGSWSEDGDAFAWAERGNVFVRFADADSARNLTEGHRAPSTGEDTTKLSFSLEAWRQDGGALLVRSREGYHVVDPRGSSVELVLPFEGDEDTRPRLDLQRWSADGRWLYLSTSARDRWDRGLVRYDLQARRTEELVKDANLYRDWHVTEDGGRIVYRMSDGDRPDELYAAGAGFSDPRRLTELNPQLEEVALTRSELVEYLDVDGEHLYGVLYYPYGYEPGKKYPLVAEVYETFFDNGYNENMNLITARGWFAFRPSVNLVVGYPGEAWLKGVTTGINTLIDRGLVDEKRLGVEGQSYGGYAVNLLVTQTNRFAAAANVSGKVDIISFLGDSEKITTRNYSAAEEGQDRIGATLWEQPQKYIAHSAIMFADRIDTPLLLLSGEGDWNVPATNEREMYYALRRLGKEVVWVNYMHGGHGAGRASTPEDFHDHWKRLLDWMGDHFDEVDAKAAATDGGR